MPRFAMVLTVLAATFVSPVRGDAKAGPAPVIDVVLCLDVGLFGVSFGGLGLLGFRLLGGLGFRSFRLVGFPFDNLRLVGVWFDCFRFEGFGFRRLGLRGPGDFRFTHPASLHSELFLRQII